MEHPLDNPVWEALVGPHACWASGGGAARHYPRDMTPFSAIAEPTARAYFDLAADLPSGAEARLFRPAEENAPPGWETISVRPIVQMVCDGTAGGDDTDRAEVATLGDADKEAMLSLAEATRPGPFARRTALLGDYVGVWREDRLVAMAGERFRFRGYVELSAICVDPAHRGGGLGGAVTRRLAQRALARGDTPFLHVFPDNPAASLYRRLGFRERARLFVLWRRPMTDMQ